MLDPRSRSDCAMLPLHMNQAFLADEDLRRYRHNVPFCRKVGERASFSSSREAPARSTESAPFFVRKEA